MKLEDYSLRSSNLDNDLIFFKVNSNIELAKQQLYVTGNKSYALEILNDCVLIKPSDYNIWQLLGSAYLMNKNFDMSNMCFKTSITNKFRFDRS